MGKKKKSKVKSEKPSYSKEANPPIAKPLPLVGFSSHQSFSKTCTTNFKPKKQKQNKKAKILTDLKSEEETTEVVRVRDIVGFSYFISGFGDTFGSGALAETEFDLVFTIASDCDCRLADQLDTQISLWATGLGLGIYFEELFLIRWRG